MPEERCVDAHGSSLADCPIVPGDQTTPPFSRPPSRRISKVLIANRGEIAVRVARACRDQGLASVAVYSDADRGAMHVRMADEAYPVGGARASESYLSTANLLRALERSGADAVHPGYGFFAENAGFARAVIGAGATWVGPPPEAIEVMGDKISSRLAAARAGVAAVPGTTVALSGPGEVVDFGEAYGWPVAIKAAFGGGGRGMRVVESAAGAAEALASAQRESEAAFGRAECYLEKYLPWPRHVEVQVLADGHGNVVHLGTRDCSVQRRHQKLVEEAPAPDIAADVIEAMGDAATRVARSCGYVNAGTVELIYQDGEFFFLEMNTRLQVEHPVTEMVTGLDLVSLQLLVARGEQLPFSQQDVVVTGHAIEARVNAEDCASGRFLPTPGTLTRFRTAAGPWARTDAGYEAGDTVSQHYDNLVAKVVAWGPDRDTARRRLLRALGETRVEGVATTIPVHQAVLAHEDFISVAHSTTWLASHLDLSGITPWTSEAPSGEEPPRDVLVDVEVAGRRYEVSVRVPPGFSGLPAGRPDGGPAGAGPPGRRGPGDDDAGVGQPAGGKGAPGPVSGEVAVPMQGTVVKVLVSPGDRVEPGQALCVLEAMKMENNIVAEIAGEVTEVRVSPGSSVGTGDVVVVVVP